MRIMKLFVVFAGLLILAGWGKSDLQQGKDYFRAQQADKAIDSFTKAIQSNPKEQEAYFFRGATFSAIGRFDQAIDDYSKVIELNPQHEEAYWSRGYCYQNKRMDDKAIADYTESLRLGTRMSRSNI
ncbi:MAG: tetratricopeptide repeat protein [Candidatus Omnitrophica bacterium]|nr:tetratricopeptide repeat protein [Candidatus Omnitrophota bacterium]